MTHIDLFIFVPPFLIVWLFIYCRRHPKFITHKNMFYFVLLWKRRPITLLTKQFFISKSTKAAFRRSRLISLNKLIRVDESSRVNHPVVSNHASRANHGWLINGRTAPFMPCANVIKDWMVIGGMSNQLDPVSYCPEGVSAHCAFFFISFPLETSVVFKRSTDENQQTRE